MFSFRIAAKQIATFLLSCPMAAGLRKRLRQEVSPTPVTDDVPDEVYEHYIPKAFARSRLSSAILKGLKRSLRKRALRMVGLEKRPTDPNDPPDPTYAMFFPDTGEEPGW